ncbi:hypothetical protein D9M69_410930 [compost metagenome]
MGVDHRGEEDEVVPRPTDVLGHADHPRQQARRRDDRQAGVAAEGIDAFQLDDEVEALVHQQREGVRRVQADGGDDRRDLVAEVAAHPALELGGPVAAADEVDLVLGQLRQQDVVEDAVLAGHLLVHQLADARHRLVRQQAVGAGLFAGEGDLLLQAGDADLEELVEVAGEDQQELQTFEQRIGLIQRLLQHADVELQLGQFTVDVQAAVIQARHHQGCRGRGWRRDRRRCDDRGRRRVCGRRLGGRRNLGGLLQGFEQCAGVESFGVHLQFLGGAQAPVLSISAARTAK